MIFNEKSFYIVYSLNSKPAAHLQRYIPGRLMQSAMDAQVCVPRWHSSISLQID